MRLLFFLTFFCFSAAAVQAQFVLAFQGGENTPEDNWPFTSTGAGPEALEEAESPPNIKSGDFSLVVGGTDPAGGSCFGGGTGNGAAIDNTFIFESVDLSGYPGSPKQLEFWYGSRQPYCNGTGWDMGENLIFTPVIDGEAGAPIVLETGGGELSLSIQETSYTYDIPECAESFGFELMINLNRRDELLFLDDVSIFVAGSDVPVSADAGDDIQGCTNEPVLLLGSLTGGFIETFQWTAASGNFHPPFDPQVIYTPAADETGSIPLVLSALTVCGTLLSDTMILTLSPRPETPVISGDSIYCEGETLDLMLSDTDSALYRFVRPDNSLAFTQNLVIDSMTQAEAGTYFGFISVEGCESFRDSIDVSVIPAPLFNFPEDDVLCQGESFLISTGLDPDGLSFTWQDGSEGPEFTATETGTYFADVTNEFECTASDTIFLLFNPLPENPAVSGNDIACEGDNLTLESQDQDGVTYTWSDPQGNVIGTDAVLVLTDLNAQLSGLYSVQAEAENCLSETVEFTVEISENPVVILPGDTLICEGEEIVIAAQDGFASYSWSTGEEESLIIVGEGTYELTVTDEAGCTGSNLITVTESGPAAAFSFTPTATVEPGVPVSFTDQSEIGQAAIASRSWDFGDGRTSAAANPQHSYESSGVYTVTLTVTDENGCSSTAEVAVNVTFDLRIPEGFSPNGDGINDIFVIRGLEAFPNSTLHIFNRWGSVVFETTRYNNDWDGDNLPAGTYFYILKLPNGEEFAGPLTLAR